ncbi:hypothetical protein BDV34DRAFT_229356 [Aspergillus parasiticus]|uniref:Oocyst wall protein n=1 Tax=Aspergillus parasiticus TaxID=5067 RepID=A0A5N6D874_ASPPA|nr:hypothetical protein BDV34DRAFT_229356 [Aspergillus parasiticus]
MGKGWILFLTTLGGPVSFTLGVSCPPGYTFDGNACRSFVPPQCPPGTRQLGAVCVTNGPPECPPGLRFNGWECVMPQTRQPLCPSGYTLHDNRCVEDSLVQEDDAESGLDKFRTQGEEGSGPASPACSPDEYFDGRVCRTAPACAPDEYFDGRMCRTAPSCAPGMYFDGRVCRKDSPSQKPQKLPNIPSDREGTQVFTPPICAPGDVFDGTHCVRYEAFPDDLECPPTMNLVNGACVPHSY